MSETRATYSGRARRHGTRWTVRASDGIARWIITIGGLGTIVSVLTVFAFLTWVVLPLFLPGGVTSRSDSAVPWQAPPLEWRGNDQRTLTWSVSNDAKLQVVSVSDGRELATETLFNDAAPVCVSRSESSNLVVLGMPDGAIRLSTIAGSSSVIDRAELPAALRDLAPGEVARWENRLVEYSDSGVFQLQTVEASPGETIEVGKSPLERIDQLERSSPEEMTGPGPVILAWERGGVLHVISTRKDEISGGLRVREKGQIQLARDERPLAALLMARGASALVVYEDGLVVRYDLSDVEKISAVESQRVLDGDGRVTAACMVLGRETLLVGDSRGRVTAWFLVRPASPAQPETAAGPRLTPVHTLVKGGSRVTALASSARSRAVAIGSEDGRVRVMYVTTEQPVAEFEATPGKPVDAIRISPRDDGLLVTIDGRLKNYDLHLGHPEASFRSFFTAVWYEGYDEPQHIWQSSFAGVEPEIKLGLWPLVFGTLKATLYAMLFAAPLALLAAVYTSEFSPPAARMRIKPAIEMMASLPSVVLGFLAALVLAPILETMLPAVLASFVVLPLTFVVAAEAWQILPTRIILRFERLRLVFILSALAIGLFITSRISGPIEKWLFAGDILLWLDRQQGTGIGASLFLLLPLSLVLTAFANSVWVNRWLLKSFPHLSRSSFAVLNVGKVVVEIGMALAAAFAVAMVFDWMGLDLRGSLVDTYVQRNALIVGFAVGFAVVPLIFTIAEDALATVPQHLRSASLGAGATAWQTAIRVVIPTAMSGLFSAVMIGLGRAVGETMIILMAAGNTPVMSLNPFNGCRTLSANIAVELPEAVRDSTHYRTLFFAGFVLFILTFLVNTTAEAIRLRFRRRAYQL